MATENHPQALAARARRERLDGLDDLDAGDDPLQDGFVPCFREKSSTFLCHIDFWIYNEYIDR